MDYLVKFSPSDDEALQSLTVPIPHNEAARLQTLHQSFILESDIKEDPEFDRIIALTSRVFDSPSFLGFITASKEIFTHTHGELTEDWTELPRSDTICTHLMLENSPDVLLIENALENKKFANVPAVTQMGVRFYAGAPILLDGFKIGALCLVHDKPRTLNQHDLTNLLDLSAVVSDMVQKKRNYTTALAFERSKLLFDISHNIRTPLSVLDATISNLNLLEQKNKYEEGRITISVTSSYSDKTRNFRSFLEESKKGIEDAKTAIEQLNLVVDNNLTAMKFVVQGKTRESVTSELCSVVNLVERIKSQGDKIDVSKSIFHWSYRDLDSALGSTKQITYPEVLEFSVISMLYQLYSRLDSINIDITFSPIDVESSQSETKFINGQLFIKISFIQSIDTIMERSSKSSKSSRTNSETGILSFASSSNHLNCGVGEVSFIAISQALRNVSGLFDKSTCCTDKYSQKTEYTVGVPCASKMNLAPSSKSYNKGTSQRVTSLKTIPNVYLPDKTESSKGISDRKIQVLLIEDSLMIQKTLGKSLENFGCNIKFAVNGKIGLQLLKSQPFDLVLCDFLMPVMSGPEMLHERIKWMHKMQRENCLIINEQALIVGLSATATAEECVYGFDSGMHFFITKPASNNALNTLIKAMELAALSKKNVITSNRLEAAINYVRSSINCRVVSDGYCSADKTGYILARNLSNSDDNLVRTMLNSVKVHSQMDVKVVESSITDSSTTKRGPHLSYPAKLIQMCQRESLHKT